MEMPLSKPPLSEISRLAGKIYGQFLEKEGFEEASKEKSCSEGCCEESAFRTQGVETGRKGSRACEEIRRCGEEARCTKAGAWREGGEARAAKEFWNKRR